MSTLFFPVIPFLLQLVVIAFFAVVAMFLASSGEPKYVLPVDPGDGSCPKENGTPLTKKVDSHVPKATLLRFLISAEIDGQPIDVTCKAANGTYYVPSDDQTATDFPNCECMFLSYGVTNYVIYMHVSM